MAINKAMLMALKALSYPDVDIKKIYKTERAVLNIKSPKLLKPVYKLWDHVIVCGGREVLVRVYTPKDIVKNDVLLFFHGGGWVTESIDTYNRVCLNLSNGTGCRVVSVEYSLAPENPFPVGLSECYAVAKEIITSPEFQGDIRVTIIGDSAGGNLAAALSTLARDTGDFEVERQILIYPALYNDYSENSKYKSVVENGTDFLLTSKKISDYIALYKGADMDLSNPYFAPLLTESFENLPKTLIITAEFDPLRDEAEDYGRKLKKAGNYVKVYRMKDALHGFCTSVEVCPCAKGV